MIGPRDGIEFGEHPLRFRLKLIRLLGHQGGAWAEIAENLKATVIGMIAEVAFRELGRHCPALLCLSHSIQWFR